MKSLAAISRIHFASSGLQALGISPANPMSLQILFCKSHTVPEGPKAPHGMGIYLSSDLSEALFAGQNPLFTFFVPECKETSHKRINSLDVLYPGDHRHTVTGTNYGLQKL